MTYLRLRHGCSSLCEGDPQQVSLVHADRVAHAHEGERVGSRRDGSTNVVQHAGRHGVGLGVDVGRTDACVRRSSRSG